MLDMDGGTPPNSAAQTITSSVTGIRKLLSSWEWSQPTFPWWLALFKSVLFYHSWPKPQTKPDGMKRKTNVNLRDYYFYCSPYHNAHVFLTRRGTQIQWGVKKTSFKQKKKKEKKKYGLMRFPCFPGWKMTFKSGSKKVIAPLSPPRLTSTPMYAYESARNSTHPHSSLPPSHTAQQNTLAGRHDIIVLIVNIMMHLCLMLTFW